MFQHHSDLLIRCASCASKFKTEEEKEAHVAKMVNGKCSLKCSHIPCEKSFDWLGDLNRHVLEYHKFGLHDDEEYLRCDKQMKV